MQIEESSTLQNPTFSWGAERPRIKLSYNFCTSKTKCCKSS